MSTLAETYEWPLDRQPDNRYPVRPYKLGNVRARILEGSKSFWTIGRFGSSEENPDAVVFVAFDPSGGRSLEIELASVVEARII